ncbi:YoaK family protein, partial [Streptomyces synnematoformans]|uniref:YoaK family protein n=1 Tax=Streptomyces synnematoformans TaxID=415721 RepID=UPI0031CECB04
MNGTAAGAAHARGQASGQADGQADDQADGRDGAGTGGRPVRRRVTPAALILALTFATGAVDAVGYLHLDQVFAGNMTGNVAILGMAATGGTGLPVLGPALALAFFLVGAAVAGRLLRTAAPGWSRRCTALLGGVGLALAATAPALAAFGTGAPGARAATASSLALAMGMQAATARHLAVKDV